MLANEIEINGIIYRRIAGAKCHYVSECGLFYSLERQRNLNPYKPKENSYLTLNIRGAKTRYAHRLVALSWVPNPDNLPEVNHRDLVKENICANNLEWCTHEQNMAHAVENNAGVGVRKNPTGGGHNKGMKATEETKALQSAAKIGTKHPRFKGYYSTPLGLFASLQEAANVHNLSKVSIRTRILNTNLPEYSFIPL